MSTERWRRIEELFGEALEQPPGMRSQFVARRCEDPFLRDEVVSLVDCAELSSDFLSIPALDSFARQVSLEGWSVRPGDRIGAYTIVSRLGAGGMGEVWRARDHRLGRDAAIKFLLPHASDTGQRAAAFEREARAAGGLNHPNVLTVYDVGDHRGSPYIVTECLEGESLRSRLAREKLPLPSALHAALQIARGLLAAHGRGIVHRDLKPENIFLTADGGVKILDFGLAALASGPAPTGGTAGYVAPEQMRGETVDAGADVFAFGTVLDEIAGRDHRGVARIIGRCVEALPADRPAMHEVIAALESAVRELHPAPAPRVGALLRRPLLMVPVVLVLVGAAAAAWWWRGVAARTRWAHEIAAPEIRRLFMLGDSAAAFLLAENAVAAVPADSQLRQLWVDVTAPVPITTEPAGADVFVSSYRSPSAQWVRLGQTPLRGVRIPRGLSRLRITKPGFEPFEGTASPQPNMRFLLAEAGSAPPGMVLVTGGRDETRFGALGAVADFWIDRFEVTNRQFKAFIDAGGYRNRGYWREPILVDGRTVNWETAVQRFHDRSGQPGPATWTGGTYPDGQGDFPVGGVSWYEAAAYARFAGKNLPTMYHWYRAAGLGRFADILPLSNFNGSGPAAAGHYAGLGTFGTYDMAGNVKEWCWNETGRGRFALGGGWNEPPYMFADYDARPPLERAANVGFRLATYRRPPTAAELAPVTIRGPETVLARKPVSDEVFAAYRRQYAYDRTPLRAAIESSEETSRWTRVIVSFDAAYGGERMQAHLFLPRDSRAPYQTVVFFPGGDAFNLASSRDMAVGAADLIVRSGRAFLYPIYKGTYERGLPEDTGANAQRDLQIAWSRDLGRAIDYLDTRADIDRERLAYYGISAGGGAGVILTALEGRFKASVLQGAGLIDEPMPELDARNYAPRIRVPTLMMNGRYDFALPLETSQRPLFDLLGTPAADKRLESADSGHAVPPGVLTKVIPPWLDRYLGPVTR